MKKYLFLVFAFCSATFMQAQQLPQFTSYQLSPFLYNPAYAGVNGHTQLNAVVREQWSGIDKAPETKSLSIFGPLRNAKMALGGMVISDKLGAESKNGFQLSYAYHLRLKDDLSLSLGISGGLMQYKLDNTVINPFDSGDPVFNVPGLMDVVPNASFGAYLYSEKYYLSLAVPQLLTSSFSATNDFDVELLSGSLVNHYYFGGGYIYQLNQQWELEPSLLVKMIPEVPIQLELTTKATYKKMLWTALGYRQDESALLFLGYNLSDQFYIAYGHDFITSDLNKVSSGTNEFKIGMRFSKPE